MLSEKTVNLRRLLQNGVEWSFDDQLKTDVDTLKKLVTAAPVFLINIVLQKLVVMHP